MDEQPWLVTATHVDTRSAGREPWGVQHARPGGASRTACGLPAANWPMFWHLSFDLVGPAQRCRSCEEIVLRGILENRRRRTRSQRHRGPAVATRD